MECHKDIVVIQDTGGRRKIDKYSNIDLVSLHAIHCEYCNP